METSDIPVRHRISRLWLLVLIPLLLLAVGLVPRLRANAQVRQIAAANSIPLVQVISPRADTAARELLLPGRMQPWAEASVRSRSSGYVVAWSADIGARVVAQAPLATIVAPELAAQWQQARELESTARVNLSIAQTTAQRWQEMLRTESISQQETDQRLADLQARRTEVAAAQANVARLAQMLAYTRLVAPFAGVVTARNVDVGTLVDAGASGELFHVAQTDRLRVLVAVPEDAAGDLAPGASARLLVGGRTVDATVARSSGVLDSATRTMHVEIDVPNPDGRLLPGGFVQVRLSLTGSRTSHQLPVEALLFRPEGPTVAVVGSDDKVVLKRVQIGRDLGTHVEVDAGVTDADRVIVSPGDAIVAGQAVRIAPPAPKPAAPS